MTRKTRMAFFISFVFSVIILMATSMIFKQSSEILNRDAENRMVEQLERAEENISLLLDNIVLDTEKLSRNQTVIDYFNKQVTDEEMNMYLESLMIEKNEKRPVYMDLFLMNSEGAIVSAVVKDAIGTVDGKKRWYFINTVETGVTSTSDVLSSQANQVQIVITLTPIVDNNQVKGYFGLAIYASYFSDFLENFEVNENDYIIIDSYDNILSHPNKALIQEKFKYFSKSPGKLYEFSSILIDHQEYFTLMKDLGFKRWRIVSLLSGDEIYSKSKELAYSYFKLGAVLIVVAVVMGFYITDYVTKPIIKITDSINKIIEEGDVHRSNLASKIPVELLDDDESFEISAFKRALIGLKETLDNSMQGFEMENSKLRDYVNNVDNELKNVNNRNLEFIATLSHDIRTPLTLIKGYASGLASDIAKDEMMNEKFKAGIIESANSLEYLIYDVLDFAYEVSDYHIYQMKSVKITDFVTQLLFEIQQIYSDERVIEFDIDEFSDEWLRIDKMQITRVVVNLINNSIKYSKGADKIVLRLKLIKEGIRICVYDQGSGISVEDQANIFEMFYRGSNRRDIKGYGLGLYISGHIIKRHKSYIYCNSELGVFTEMMFEIHHDSREPDRYD